MSLPSCAHRPRRSEAEARHLGLVTIQGRGRAHPVDTTAHRRHAGIPERPDDLEKPPLRRDAVRVQEGQDLATRRGGAPVPRSRGAQAAAARRHDARPERSRHRRAVIAAPVVDDEDLERFLRVLQALHGREASPQLLGAILHRDDHAHEREQTVRGLGLRLAHQHAPAVERVHGPSRGRGSRDDVPGATQELRQRGIDRDEAKRMPGEESRARARLHDVHARRDPVAHRDLRSRVVRGSGGWPIRAGHGRSPHAVRTERPSPTTCAGAPTICTQFTRHSGSPPATPRPR